MPVPRRALLAWGVAGVAAAAAGAFLGIQQFRPTGGVSQLLAEPFTDFQGRPFRLRQLPAAALLCNFWATWCEPCREEVPLLVAAKQHYTSNALEIVGIGVDTADKLQQFSEKYGIQYPILVATANTAALMRALGNNAAALPYSVLLDRRRRIAYRKLGAWRKPELDREIEAAIG